MTLHACPGSGAVQGLPSPTLYHKCHSAREVSKYTLGYPWGTKLMYEGLTTKRKLGSVLQYLKKKEHRKTDAICQPPRCRECSHCSQGGFALLCLHAQQLLSAHGLD